MILLLHSGGPDSHVCWLMHPEWQPVYVRHGAGNERAELKALVDLAKMDSRFRPRIVESVRCKARFDGHVFYRNMLLLTSALAAFPKADGVAFGALLGEGSADKSATFCRRLERVWQASEGRKVKVLRPLRHLTKAMALQRGMALPGGHALGATTSCYHGNRCGRCQACFRLGIARYLCGLELFPPELPTETLGIRATLRANKLTRWPAMALANADVARAYALHWLRNHPQKEG
jgi:7-cyano-7-deazaguanine synthase in queuosine biosynthesis